MRSPNKKRRGKAAFSVALAVLLACSLGFSSIAWAAKEDGATQAASDSAAAADRLSEGSAGSSGVAGGTEASSEDKPDAPVATRPAGPTGGLSEAEDGGLGDAQGGASEEPGELPDGPDVNLPGESDEGSLPGSDADGEEADGENGLQADEDGIALLSLDGAEESEEGIEAQSGLVHKNDVPYASGVCADAIAVDPSTIAWDGADGTSWYAASGIINMTGRIVVSGSISLILEDGCNLIASSGITVNSGSTLIVYVQSGGSGALNATASGSAAGIGSAAGASGGTIVINGGSITATGGTGGAGIGGGNGGSCGSVTINGGRITARGGGSGAGIGGGHNGNGGNVTIKGGSVTATGGSGGAGIGGGSGGSGGTTVISGGSIAANGGSSAAGLGGGSGASGGTVTISGGTTTAYGGTGIGIGAGEGGSGGTFSTQGNAFVASHTIKAARNTSGGIVIENNEGEVHGEVTLEEDVTIPQGVKLTIPENMKLTIPSGVTISNEGTLVNNGNLTNYGSFNNSRQFNNNGSFVNNGRFSNQGTLQGNGSIQVGQGASFTGKKGVQTPPPMPTLKKATKNSISLEPIAQVGVGALEYACAQGMTTPSKWQTSPDFTGLKSATNYRVYARFAGNAYFEAVESTEALRVKTLSESEDPGPDPGPDNPDNPDPVEPGSVTDETDRTNNYLGASLLDDGMALAEKALSAADLKRVQDGASVSMFLEASDAVAEGDKALVQQRIDVTAGYAVASYVDLTLWQRFDGETAPVPISECVKPVSINMQVPSGLPALSTNATRAFTLMCVHDGSVSTLPATLDAGNGGVRFEAGKFSTYALVYRDMAGGGSGGDGGNSGTGGGDSGDGGGAGAGGGAAGNGAAGEGGAVADGDGGGALAGLTPATPSVNGLGDTGSLAETGDIFGIALPWVLLTAVLAFVSVAFTRSRRQTCAEGAWRSRSLGTARKDVSADALMTLGPQAQDVLEIGLHSVDSIHENIARFTRKNARCARKMEKRRKK